MIRLSRDRGLRDRERQERGLWLEKRDRAPRRASRCFAQRTSRATGQRCARCRSARAPSLTGIKPLPPRYPDHSIFIAEDLTASDAATMEPEPSSVLRPSVAAHFARRDPRPFVRHSRRRRNRAARARIPNGTPVILDGATGSLRLSPPPRKSTASQAPGANENPTPAGHGARARDGHDQGQPSRFGLRQH